MADKFRKGKSNFATTLVTGIGTGTGDTITLNSTTGLPTDTEITLTFNRVTSGGVVNSTSVMERITGTISGATLTSYTRGVDGTTEQAHAGGVVVEYIPNAADMNDQVDGILVEHNQDGTHNTSKVVDLTTEQTLTNKTLTAPIISAISNTGTLTLPTSTDTLVGRATGDTLTNKTLTSPVINTGLSGTAKATGAEVTTGTVDTKFVTPKAIGDAGVNTRLSSKIISITRDVSATAGDVSYTGVGFQPTALVIIGAISGTKAASWSIVDSTTTGNCIYNKVSDDFFVPTTSDIYVNISTGNNCSGTIKSFDSDGFTITWAKTGTPTGDWSGYVLCFR